MTKKHHPGEQRSYVQSRGISRAWAIFRMPSTPARLRSSNPSTFGKARKSRYYAWLDIVGHAQWRNPEDVKVSYPKASILKGSRVVFNIKGNDYRLIARLAYPAQVLAIRFFGNHSEYDRIDAETV